MLPVVQLDFKGLYTMQNQLSQVPPGACTIANNVNCDRTGIAETRRGFEFYGDMLDAAAIKGYIFDETLLWYLDNGNLVHDTGAGVWSTYAGSFFPPAGSYLFSAQSSGNFYFTTNNGVYKIDSLTGIPRLAGVPPALDLQGEISGMGNVVLDSSQVGYQVLFGYIDANDNLELGAPSAFLSVVNSSGSTQNVDLEITIPNGLTTDYFVQVYRTANTNGLAIPPGNNAQLAIEQKLTSGDISTGSLTITDNIPDSLLGAFVYTADGQPGNFPNNPPPLCVDLCTFQGMTFYANYQTEQKANITLDSVGSPDGIQVGDTLSITDVDSSTTYTYTGAVANNPTTREFEIVTSGSIASNIDETARNIVAVINQDPNNSLFYAYYITGENILPGAITLSAQNLQNGQFYINSSRQTCWTPAIPAATQEYISSNNRRPSGFLVSKPNQPEAVPLAYEYLLQAGSTNITILRAIALQDAVYMFTTGGIFRVTGSDPTALQTLLFDSSAQMRGIDTAVVLNNSIYYSSTQGVCSVSSGGNQIMSRNIERDLLTIEALSQYTSLAFGCSYESDRRYLLWTPNQDNNTAAVQSFANNWITETWTLWTRAATAAIVNPAPDRLYIADSDGFIFQERKAFTNEDFADQSYAINIDAVNTTLNQLTLTSSVNVQIGDVIQQTSGPTQNTTQVLGNDLLTGIVDVVDATDFVTGAAIDYRSIATQIQFAPIHGGYQEYVKKFSGWQFYFSNANFNTLLVRMSSDWYPQAESVEISPIQFGGWGTLPWGTFNWGVSTIPQQMIPTWATKNTGYAHWVIINLSLTQAFTSLALDGVSAIFDVVSTRGR